MGSHFQFGLTEIVVSNSHFCEFPFYREKVVELFKTPQIWENSHFGRFCQFFVSFFAQSEAARSWNKANFRFFQNDTTFSRITLRKHVAQYAMVYKCKIIIQIDSAGLEELKVDGNL